MGTFVAILLGTIAGGVVVAMEPNGPILACALSIAMAVAGYLVSRGIPHTPAVAPDLAINWNPFSETWRNLRIAQENRVVWLSMLGISWFWFYGATFLALYALIQERSAPSHRSRIIAANNILNALFIVASAGIAVALLDVGLSIPELFLVNALMNAAVALFIYLLVPEFLMRFLAWILIHS